MPGIQFHVYDRQLSRPFRFGQRELRSRKGIFLRHGESFGEAAPLEGHSTDSLQECLSCLLALGADGVLEPNVMDPLPPSLRFAIEALHAKLSPSALSEKSLYLNGLIPALAPELLQQEINRLASEGFSNLKMKLTPENIQGIPSVLGYAAAEFPKLRFRLDANRSLNLTEWKQFQDMVAKSNASSIIEYVEEPSEDLERAAEAGVLKVAADESAPTRDDCLRLAKAGVTAFILKPMGLGGMKPALALADELNALGAQTTFSSLLESSIGRRHIIHSLLQSNRKEVAGLAVSSLFMEDFLSSRPIYRGYQYLLPEELAWLNSLSWESLP